MSFDDHAGFSPEKMADIGGRALPTPDKSEDNSNEIFGQAKMEAIGGKSLPKPDQGASTLSPSDKGNVDSMGQFPSKN